MYTDDQDEEVEEEEEFHEVEEEKHKTSQDAVNDSSSNHKKAPEKKIPSTSAESTDVDWANIMMRSQSKNSDLPTGAELSSNSVSLSDIPSDLKDTEKPSDDSIINNIIKETEDKLKIVDESCESTHQNVTKDPTVGELHVSEPISEAQEAQVGDEMQSGSDQPRTSSQSDVSFASPNPDSSPEQQPQPGFCLDENPISEQDLTVDLTEQKQISDSPQNPEEAQTECKDSSDPNQYSKAESNDSSPGQSAGHESELVDNDVDQKEAAEVETDEKKSEDPEKKELDLDEDVKNPQYIPKKGVFYEHDDRSHDVEEKKTPTTQKEGDEVETKEVNASKRTPSQEKQAENRRNNRKQRTDADRWNHDLFRGERQKPKSKSELVNAYGYDIRQERAGRSQQSDSRQSRSGKSSNHEKNTTMQDGQQSRQTKDSRIQRQNQPGNRSRDRRSRRQNVSKVSQQQQRSDGPTDEIRRDLAGGRPARNDVRDSRDGGDKEAVAAVVPSVPTTTRREQDVSQMSRNPRTDSRGRRKSSRERQSNNEERLPLTNTVMPPITTWSNEDMMKAEAFGKGSPPRAQNINNMTATGSNNQSIARDRSSELWQQGQQNKTIYQERPPRNQDESRQHGYNSRGRYQDRGDENHRPAHYLSRNQYHDRTNQNHDWHRANNFGSYGKPNDYVVKTQTFENSRLSQANMGRSNNRDLREVINERRMQGQTYHNKIHHGVDHHVNSRGHNQGQLYQHQYAQPHMVMQQHHMAHNQQQPPQMLMMQSQQHQQTQQQQTSRHLQMPMSSQQQASTPPQVNSQTSQAQLTNHRQQPTTTQSQSHQVSARQTTLPGSTVEQDSARGSSSSTSTDPANSRPIIKTDAYTGNMHQQHAGQHSQGHRSMGGPLSQQNSAPATSHMVPSHLGSAAQPQYYTPSPGSRDPTANAAAVASAYHGYLPGSHAVMDAARYHMASQQLTDHGYMANPNQTGDVSGGVVHQQGMYPDTSAGGAVANSTYMAQHPSSTISPNSIPVTGAGAQLPPVPYIQHSQYPPPPYTNPYSQPQHNQGPPQSSHAYPPYWTYI